MASYIQADRAMSVITPLEKDALLLIGFSGTEGISQLFHFQLDLIAENATKVAFDKLLGQRTTIQLLYPGKEQARYFSGVCNRFSQGGWDDTFTHYRMEIVPEFWLLTRRAQSRIYQQMSVPDILKKVLDGLDIAYEIQGTFHPRDYCVQYRETDFNFASRLMEEEGIYYFFKHTAEGHKMVMANTPQSHPDMPFNNKFIFETMEGGHREEERVLSWEKTQELRSGKYTLWDHHFELPHKHLEANKPIQDTIPVGEVTHKLKVGGNDKLEIYDWPGEYAQRFDGVAPGGGDRASDLQKIFKDNERTVEIRMQQEALGSILIHSTSDLRQVTTGYKFALERHLHADGQYLCTSVTHHGSLGGDYRSGGGADFVYENSFTCIPFAMPFRPPRVTPKPVIQGTQTAVVVGPPGEEIFTDKYSRVKVQFHWDREGKYNADSSCWIRVGTPWAGKQWGIVNIPRIGHEAIVAFEEGDPDRPIIVGVVYNADMMPPNKLPDKKNQSGIKSYSTLGGGGHNEIRFDDTKGKETHYHRSQKDFHERVNNDAYSYIGRDKNLTVERDYLQYIKRDVHKIIDQDQVVKVNRHMSSTIAQNETTKVGGAYNLKVGGVVVREFGSDAYTEVASSYALKANKLILEATGALTIKAPGGFVKIDAKGVTIVGTKVNINSGGSGDPIVGQKLIPAWDSSKAIPPLNTEPGSKAPNYENTIAKMSPSQLALLNAPAFNPKSEESKDKKGWVEVHVVDEASKDVPGQKVTIKFPSGETYSDHTNEKGLVRVEGFDEGQQVKISLDLDGSSWEEA